MSESKPNASEVLDRLSSSYGVTTQKELAVCLEISPGNVSAWVQRGSVPGNAIIKCALDTGADLKWLVTGLFANANANVKNTNISKNARADRGKTLLKKMLSAGGRSVLKRILEAYGFTTQKELSEYLEISTGTISTWVRREYFPGDVVITCALDTGVSLEWLAIGSQISSREVTTEEINHNEIPKLTIISGAIKNIGYWSVDLKFLPKTLYNPNLLYSTSCSWLIDMGINEISNGRWLLGIDDKFDIYDVTLLPGKKISVKTTISSFICGIKEISVAGKVVFTMEYNI